MESTQIRYRKKFQKGFINFGTLITLLLLSSLALLVSKNPTPQLELHQTVSELSDHSIIAITHIQSGNKIKAEVAKSSLKRQTGLMNRVDLSDESGMLFIFEKEQNLTFWMKNTPMSLDIIFLDSNFKVVQFFENTRPNQTKETYTATSSIYVLETLAGFSSRSNLKIGDSFKIVE
jgi:uncharacterized membrane protein (UPF0127 family)